MHSPAIRSQLHRCFCNHELMPVSVFVKAGFSRSLSPSPTAAEPSTAQGTAHRRHMQCHMLRHTERFHMAKHTRANFDGRIKNNSCILSSRFKTSHVFRLNPVLHYSSLRTAGQVKLKRLIKESRLAFTSSHHPSSLAVPPSSSIFHSPSAFDCSPSPGGVCE